MRRRALLPRLVALCVAVMADPSVTTRAQPTPEPQPIEAPVAPSSAAPTPAPADTPAPVAEPEPAPIPEPTLVAEPVPGPEPESVLEPAPVIEPEPFGATRWLPEIHAFVSQGFLLSTDNNYLARSKDGTFEFTEVALNVTQVLGDRLRVGLQLFSRKLGPSGDYSPEFDWYYLDYRIDDWLGIRAGRIKIPFGLYNESNDIDAGRVPVLLPQSIYPDHHRDLLLALTGGELYGNIALGDAGQLEYRAYGGTFDLEGELVNPNVDSIETEVQYLTGARLMWLTPIAGLQLGGTFQALRYDIESAFDPAFTQVLIMADLAPDDFAGVIELEFPIQLWVASIEYVVGDLLLAAEYGRWWADLHSSHPEIIPSSGPTNERYYVMAWYRFASWFSSSIYYSGYYEDVEKRDDYGKYQHDLAATVRFDLTSHWLLKLEGHLMLGTGALKPELNDGKELDTLAREWGFFLIKTTAYF